LEKFTLGGGKSSKREEKDEPGVFLVQGRTPQPHLEAVAIIFLFLI